MRESLKVVLAAIMGVTASYCANQIPKLNIGATALIVLGVVVFLLLLVILLLPRIKSSVNQYFIANIRGFWGSPDLDKQVERDYKNSGITKIKVTRGYNLFYSEQGVFYQCFFKNSYGENKTVQVLLHFPCLKSEHLKQRAKTNLKTSEEYIENLFSVIKKFKDHTKDESKDEDISIKFYLSDEESEWRYYIFKNEKHRKTLYFNHYDSSVPGIKSKMLKIKGGNNSLCESMDKTFDLLFNDHSVELVENLKSSSRLKNSNFCGHPACEAKIKSIYERIFNT